MPMYVYIVECNDNSYYTGVTNNVERRVHEHNVGQDPGSYTFSRRPVTIRFVQECPGELQAIAFEKQLKGWSRKKKLAIIEGRWNDLPMLSRNRQAPFEEPPGATEDGASTSSA